MKKLLLLCLSMTLIVGCSSKKETVEMTPEVMPEETAEVVIDQTFMLTDGIYRGAFTDAKQLEIEFEVKAGIFETMKFRTLTYKGEDYLKSENKTYMGIKDQYMDLVNYLIGKELSVIADIYMPEKITKDTDAVTAATLRSSKLITAIYDGAKRGVYKTTATTEFIYKSYTDGTYRGAFTDPSQIEVEFTIKDNMFEEIKYRSLGYKGEDYLKTENEVFMGITKQYQDLTQHLIGKEISAIKDLYQPEMVTKDTDAVTAATLRGSKLISALHDGLERGVYKLSETSVIDYQKNYENGVYRGAFTDPKQIEIEFELDNNMITSIKYRSLGYKGDDYLTTTNDVFMGITQQYQDLADYLVGKDLNAIKELYVPSGITKDTDAVTAATLRSSKFISALNDALARDVYKATKE